ncbi:hypothetical protein [Tistrella mobilis]|uniref:Uncharacterized protein n=1 Tax=Tistrella mobilis (strain KA081020-065) TaxID=1110502 RepID=I3TGM7_TISMK|nr:hypothetical protein [Tistrella mobilis]AFK51915.1 hypothetical protein TMO_0076 [Tistrella mobilis KA081020-065]
MPENAKLYERIYFAPSAANLHRLFDQLGADASYLMLHRYGRNHWAVQRHGTIVTEGDWQDVKRWCAEYLAG